MIVFLSCVAGDTGLISVPSCGFILEFQAHGLLGVFTENMFVDRHLWAVRRGYVPGPAITGCGSGVVGLQA